MKLAALEKEDPAPWIAILRANMNENPHSSEPQSPDGGEDAGMISSELLKLHLDEKYASPENRGSLHIADLRATRTRLMKRASKKCNPVPVALHMEGMLKKKSPKTVMGRTVWQSRYFSTNERDMCLEYWNKNRETRLGFLPFSKINVVEDSKRKKHFTIQLQGQRAFELVAPSEEQYAEWMDKLSACTTMSRITRGAAQSDDGATCAKFWKEGQEEAAQAEERLRRLARDAQVMRDYGEDTKCGSDSDGGNDSADERETKKAVQRADMSKAMRDYSQRSAGSEVGEASDLAIALDEDDEGSDTDAPSDEDGPATS